MVRQRSDIQEMTALRRTPTEDAQGDLESMLRTSQQFYDQLYSTDPVDETDLAGISELPQLSDEAHASLLASITLEEILSATLKVIGEQSSLDKRTQPGGDLCFVVSQCAYRKSLRQVCSAQPSIPITASELYQRHQSCCQIFWRRLIFRRWLMSGPSQSCHRSLYRTTLQHPWTWLLGSLVSPHQSRKDPLVHCRRRRGLGITSSSQALCQAAHSCSVTKWKDSTSRTTSDGSKIQSIAGMLP